MQHVMARLQQLTKSKHHLGHMSGLLHLEKNVYTHLRITDKLRAGVEVPLQTDAAQTPLKERGNTGVRNALETFSSIRFTVS